MPEFTRRQLAVVLSASALLAQTAPSTPPPLPQNPEEELKTVRESIQRNSEQLAKFPLEMSTEPAVHFKA